MGYGVVYAGFCPETLQSLLCIQKAPRVPPVDSAGSWVSVVVSHLRGFPDLPQLHHVFYQPHKSLVDNQDIYLSYGI